MSGKSASGGGGFGPLETEVMDAVWATSGPVSVREVLGQLNYGRPEPLAYTTVMTVMSRLAEKEALVRTPAGRSYVYEAAAGDPAGIAVKSVIRAYGDEAVAHFVDQARGNPELRRRMEQMLREQ